MSKLKPYPKYKDSGVEWIGEVPERWEQKRIKHFMSKKAKRSDSSLPYGAISFGKAIYKSEELARIDDKSTYQVLDCGDFLVNPLNLNYDLKSLRTALSDITAMVSSGYIILQCTNDVERKYIKSLLYVFDILHMKTLGSGVRQTITFDDIGNCFVWLPPLPEQQAIAAFLDRETAQIDALITKKTRSIELLREKRQAMITHAVTKGLDPNAKMKDSGIEWIGEVPEGWEIKRVKFLLSESLKYGANESGDSFEEEAPRYIRITDLDENGNLRDASIKTLSLSKALPYMLKDGDILFARSGATVGKTFIYKEQYGPACYAGYLIKARPNLQKVLPDYLISTVRTTSYWGYIAATNIQATIENVSAEKYANFTCAIPPFLEQEAIVTYLDAKCIALDTLIAKTERSIELLREKRQALITAAVTGKIDVRPLAREIVPEAAC